jgi:hypothetical protein
MLCATNKYHKTHNVYTFIGSISKHANKLVVSGDIYIQRVVTAQLLHWHVSVFSGQLNFTDCV